MFGRRPDKQARNLGETGPVPAPGPSSGPPSARGSVRSAVSGARRGGPRAKEEGGEKGGYRPPPDAEELARTLISTGDPAPAPAEERDSVETGAETGAKTGAKTGAAHDTASAPAPDTASPPETGAPPEEPPPQDSAPPEFADAPGPSRAPRRPRKAPQGPSGGEARFGFEPRSGPLSERVLAARDKVMADMVDAVDLSSLAGLDPEHSRREIGTAVDAIADYRRFELTDYERAQLIEEICNEVLGFGPLEPLLERDDIADIMVNGADTVYIESGGKVERAQISFRDNQHLLNICQRIVSAVGRRVDESSPICDARLADGSWVNMIVGPLAVDGPVLTIRKFQKERLTFDKLVEFGSMTPACAKVLSIAATCRTNMVISGGTGSGKTTMLNCLTGYIDVGERIVTCEDACELQLQQAHVVRLETRPANTEGAGEATMRDLVRNCLRMRPDRIIVGEVRGPEAFDLLQAMNTGHDGSMGTIHANSPRECISRLENMIAMGGFNIPTLAVREQIASAVGIIVQIKRLRDGSRKVTHISEVLGMEGEVVTLQDLFTLEIEGEDENGRLRTTQKATGVRPSFWDQARFYGLEGELLAALEEAGA